MLQTTIIGHVGQDATTQFINGKQVINFSIAHTESFYSIVKDEKVKQEKTQWISCSYWSESKVHQYIKKGSLIYATGSPVVKAYVSDKGGALDVHFNLTVFRIELLGSAKKDPDQAAPPANNSTPVDPAYDLPF